MNENTTVKVVKGFFTTVGAILNSLLGVLYIPVLLVVTCNIIDYITGIMASPNRTDGKISSYRSMKGITKKVTMWLLIVVGAIIDQLILYTSDTLGFEFPFKFLIALVVSMWIICNELISILGNIIDIGVEIPPFLMPLVKNIKSQTEKSVQIEDEKKEEDSL